jgi:transposase-like protein
MAHPKKKRTQARSLYVHSRYALSVIALQLDVSTATIARWKAAAREGGDDWDIARSADMMAGEGFEKMVSDAVEQFTVMFQATMDGIQDDKDLKPGDKAKMMASLADSFNKMINSAGRAAPSLSKLGIATDVIQRLAAFVQSDFPGHNDAFLEILEPFGLELAQAYAS